MPLVLQFPKPYSWNRKCAGVVWNTEVPGYGMVLHVSGPEVVYVIDWVDQTPLLRERSLVRWKTQALCSALAK